MKRVESFASNLRRLLSARNISQTQLAHLCGLSQAILSKYLRGRATPTAQSIIAISTALSVSADELFRTSESHETRVFIKEVTSHELMLLDNLRAIEVDSQAYEYISGVISSMAHATGAPPDKA